MSISRKLLLFVPLLSLLVFSACRKDKGEVIGQSKQEYTTDEVIIIGEEMASAITNNPDFEVLALADYQAGYTYLNDLYMTIANNAPVENRLTFKWNANIIMDDDLRTAFTIPGGDFYITTGLLKFLKSESELLAVMGHEIYHADKGGVVSILNQKFGGDKFGGLVLGEPVAEINEITSFLKEITYSEDMVYSADSFSVELICPFLYDPLGLDRVIKRAQDNPASLEIDWVTHRRVENMSFRLERIFELAQDCDDFGKVYEDRYNGFKSILP